MGDSALGSPFGEIRDPKALEEPQTKSSIVEPLLKFFTEFRDRSPSV